MLLLGTPALWWGGVLALLYAVLMWVGARDWRFGVAVVGAASTWLPWFLYDDRPIFSYYAIITLPFLVLAITLALGERNQGSQVDAAPTSARPKRQSRFPIHIDRVEEGQDPAPPQRRSAEQQHLAQAVAVRRVRRSRPVPGLMPVCASTPDGPVEQQPAPRLGRVGVGAPGQEVGVEDVDVAVVVPSESRPCTRPGMPCLTGWSAVGHCLELSKVMFFPQWEPPET